MHWSPTQECHMPGSALVLRLRKPTMYDADILLAWRNDPEVIRWSRIQARQDDREGHLNWLSKRLDDKPTEIFRMIETTDCVPTGLVWMSRDSDDAVPEVHYRVDPAWRRRYIASRAVPDFVRDFIRPIRNGSFKCPIFRGNVPSERIAEKLGLHAGPAYRMSDTDTRVLVEWVQ
ncbi:MAG: hypothetical protein JWM46_287 [Candidatus Kaiserbacteria bacterium]|nr:hypothetical protein [Candidatus Kaiserbacteria bacterium]